MYPAQLALEITAGSAELASPACKVVVRLTGPPGCTIPLTGLMTGPVPVAAPAAGLTAVSAPPNTRVRITTTIGQPRRIYAPRTNFT